MISSASVILQACLLEPEPRRIQGTPRKRHRGRNDEVHTREAQRTLANEDRSLGSRPALQRFHFASSMYWARSARLSRDRQRAQLPRATSLRGMRRPLGPRDAIAISL